MLIGEEPNWLHTPANSWSLKQESKWLQKPLTSQVPRLEKSSIVLVVALDRSILAKMDAQHASTMMH